MLIVNILQSTFKVENFVIDVEKLPQQVPGEYWRYDFQQFVKKNCILQLLLDVQIQRKAHVR